MLAHAYYPYEFGNFGGDIHFDESEQWTVKPKDDYSGILIDKYFNYIFLCNYVGEIL